MAIIIAYIIGGVLEIVGLIVIIRWCCRCCCCRKRKGQILHTPKPAHAQSMAPSVATIQLSSIQPVPMPGMVAMPNFLQMPSAPSVPSVPPQFPQYLHPHQCQ